MNRFFTSIHCCLLTVTVLSCNKEKDVVVTSISLSQNTAEMIIGETVQLNATVLPSDATDKFVTWASSKQSVATITSSGFVTAVSEGTSIITASAGGKSATCSVTVSKGYVAVTGISINETAITLNKGESKTLVATITPSDATNQTVYWTSSNASIASIDQVGKITALAGGTVTIEAKAENQTAQCSVTVVVPVSRITLNKDTIELEEDSSTLLIATIEPEDATDKSTVWTSSDDNVASVDQEGLVKAIKEGKASITVMAGSISATCQITVNKKFIAVESIELNKATLELVEGDTETLTATVKPDEATDKTVSWSSSDSSIIKVDDEGHVTAVEVGLATVIAKSGDKIATCVVTVVANPIVFKDNTVESVLVSKYDTNNDGVLSYKEAAVVTTLPSYLFGSYQNMVSSFDELQYFVGLTSISDDAFHSCENLESVVIPEGVTEIGRYAFGWCYKLRRIVLPSTLVRIKAYGLFSNCLEELILPNGLETIENSGIAANKISTITLPDSIKELGFGFLRECDNLQSILGKYASEDNRCVIKDGVLLAFAPKGLTSYTTPITTRVIGQLSFSGIKELESLTINEGVTEIQKAVFEWASAPSSISLPSSILVVCSISKAKTIFCKATQPPKNNIPSYSDDRNLTGRTLYVPVQSVDAYMASEDWNKASIIGYSFD